MVGMVGPRGLVVRREKRSHLHLDERKEGVNDLCSGMVIGWPVLPRSLATKG